MRFKCLMRVFPSALVLATLTSAAVTADMAAANASPAVVAPSGTYWSQTYGDEFNTGPADLNGWTYDLGNNAGWGNSEVETYTNSTNNVFVSGGTLNIDAIGTTSNGNTTYTSGRITTQGLFSQTYGLFEFRAQLPAGNGLWPAVWMMPASSTYGSWPNSGEIDMLESKGSSTNMVQGSLHSGPSYNQQNTQYSVYTLPNNGQTTAWHTYDLLWQLVPAAGGGKQVQFTWYVDGQVYEVQRGGWTIPPSAPAGDTNAPFDQPFYMIMNLAVGGDYVNYQTPGAGTYSMKIDYVRTYTALAPEPGAAWLLAMAAVGLALVYRPKTRSN